MGLRAQSSREGSLKDKVALVTGSSQGIGEAIALSLARAGCSVVTNNEGDHQQAQQVANGCRAFGVDSQAVVADISRLSEIKHLMKETKRRFKRLDILVNNAAVFNPGEALRYRGRDWDQVFETNARGTFFCSQAAAQIMRQTGGGAIVNLSSLGAAQAWPGMAAYCASKGAIDSLTRGLACEWAPLNIRVNAVAPGHIGTADNLKWLRDRKHKRWVQARILCARLGTLEEVANVVTFLCGPAASYINGQVIYVEGGLMSWQGSRAENP
jgi:NAD(P)-dependent dehydrogenase (short-subunit alcohol dehydrogenase family)